MSFLTTLAKVGITVGKTALQIATKSHPIIGAVTEVILGSVLNAELTFGPGTGQQKKAAVTEQVHNAIPLIITMVEEVSDKDLIQDHQLFSDGVSSIIEGVVQVLNAMKILSPTVVENPDARFYC